MEGRDLNDVSASQGMPKMESYHAKLGERNGTDSPSETQRRQYLLHFDFKLLAGFRTAKECIAVVLSHQVCGSLLGSLKNLIS